MAYGLKYQSQFHSQTDENNPSKLYTLQFLFKDYTGGTTSIDGVSGCIQKCTTDDPIAPIKGQSLEISLLNKGNVPITAFQSEDDDGVMVKLLGAANEVLFVGFLVQDDFYEGMVDYSHPITLSANDSLGLLKGVILSDAAARRRIHPVMYTTNGDDFVVYVWSADTSFYPQAGDTIEIEGNAYAIVTAVREDTIIPPFAPPYMWTITVATTTGGIAQNFEPIFLTGELNLLYRNNLLSIIAVCLGQTNLSLITNIFMNLYESRQDNTVCSFEQTLIDSQLFISGDTYEDCYSVLSKILKAFNCTLFQANGQWNIVHWYEAIPKEAWSYPNNALPGFVYDEAWVSIGTTVFNNNFFIGPSPQLTRPIFPLTQGAYRGYKFSKKQFDYNFPKYLLKNYDFLQVGDLISQYTQGANTISEYVAIDWLGGDTVTYVNRFIRVTRDTATGTEQGRELVVKGDPGELSYSKSVRSQPIEVNEGDKIKLSFSVQGQNSFSGVWILVYAIMLSDGTTVRYVDELPAGNGDWVPTIGYTYTGSGNDTAAWNSVEIISSQIPYSGILSVYLTQLYGNGDETRYKDIRLEYTVNINDSTKIIGHIHKQEQDVNKKLNLSEEIKIDDTPRNPIAGTLFNTTKTGVLQDRTKYWRYPPDANGWALGELTTLEELTWRQKTRLKLEGGFIGNYQTAVISLLTMGITDFNPSKNYTFGLLTIDYKRNQFSGTLWELYDSEDAFFDPDYEFKYIYSTT